jgi:hypothetical protein
MTLHLFTGDMSHGHSHGGSDKKSKHKKDEDCIEAGDGEHLCADEKIGIEEHHGHSHATGLLTTEIDGISNGDTKSKKKNKKGCKKIVTNQNKRFVFLISSGWWSNEYSWCFSSCIK